MQPIHIYLLVYILPAFILVGVSTYVFALNRQARENQLISLGLLAFCITLIGEFLRHNVSFEYNPFITMYIVGFSAMLSMAFILHLVFNIARNNCSIKGGAIFPAIFYSLIPLHAIIIFSKIQLTVDDFYYRGIWIYRDNMLYNIWLYGSVGTMAGIAFFICLYGWRKSRSKQGKRLLRFLTLGSISVFASFVLAIAVIRIENMIPNPTMFLIVIIGIELTIGVASFNLTLSIKERYKTMFELTPIAIILLNERLEVLEMNEHANSFFYDSEDTTIRSFIQTPFNIRQGLRVIRNLRKEEKLHNFQMEFQHPVTLKKITFLFEATTIPFQGELYYYLMWQDISYEVEQEKLVHHLAFHDVLTGIQNRAYFVSNVQKKLRLMPDDQHALVLIDLNYFKQINDVHGHIVGDAVLQFIAKNLQKLVGNRGIAARLGGDEFVIFFEQIESSKDILGKIQVIQDYFAATPFRYEDFTQAISLSIGYSLFPLDGTDFEILFHIADMSMYENKSVIKGNTTR